MAIFLALFDCCLARFLHVGVGALHYVKLGLVVPAAAWAFFRTFLLTLLMARVEPSIQVLRHSALFGVCKLTAGQAHSFPEYQVIGIVLEVLVLSEEVLPMWFSHYRILYLFSLVGRDPFIVDD